MARLRPDEKIVLTTLALTVTASLSLHGATTQHARTVTIADLKADVTSLTVAFKDANLEKQDAHARFDELEKLLGEQDTAFDSTEGFIK